MNKIKLNKTYCDNINVKAKNTESNLKLQFTIYSIREFKQAIWGPLVKESTQ